VKLPTRSILEQARALIADEQRWSEHGWGQKGRRCAVHAVWDVCGRKTEAPYYHAVVALREQIGNASLSIFNDQHSHGEVLAVFDAAIGTHS
jgi:hypothetical protein